MNGWSDDLPLALAGCDFRVASSRIRSRLAMSPEEVRELADELRRGGWADGLAVLDTCNRNEWIVSSQQAGWVAELLVARMLDRLEPEDRSSIHPYVLRGEAAARHVFRVVIGQESLVVGERQIAAQVFKSLEASRRLGCTDRVLNGLGPAAGRLSRVAALRGCVCASAVGIHSLARDYMVEALGENGPTTVAVVGLGMIGRRMAALLEADTRFRVVRVNRTVTEGAGVRGLDELPQVLDEVDAAVLCTAAPSPVLRASTLAGRTAGSRLLLVDIGIPAQIEAGVGSSAATVVGLDELVGFHSRRTSNDVCTESADRLVQHALDQLLRFVHEPAYSGILQAVQEGRRRLCADVLPELAQEHLADLPPQRREELVAELRAAVNGYTGDLLRSIRGTSQIGDGGAA
jgi:glutamyl-tRNA reductase